MTQDLLAASAALLEKVGQDASEAEVENALSCLEAAAEAEGRRDAVDKLREPLRMIRQSLRDSTLSEKGLSLFIDTTHDLSKTLELEGLFRTIVRRARNLVGANIAWVTILDEESGVFRTVAAEGHLSTATTEMTSRFEYGAVGLIMQTKSFFDTQDYLNDTRIRHLRELDRVFETESIVSLAGFPILSNGEIHGFLFVADRYSRKLSGREISVLGAFALHAGVAMRNANAFRLLSEALEEAQRNRNALIEHIEKVEASAAAHDEMTSLLASGGEMTKFLQRMANQIGGAILLVGEDHSVGDEFIHTSYRGQLAGDFKAGTFATAPLVNALSQSRSSGRSAVLMHTPDEQSRVIALHGGSRRGEYLVICHYGELDAIEIRNLERSAVALAIARLWNEKRETDKLIASSTLLRHLVLVTPPDPNTLSAVRERLALSADEVVALALIAGAGIDRPSQTATIREASSGTNILVDLVDEAYVAIGSEQALSQFLKRLSKHRDGQSSGGLVSDPFADLGEASTRYNELSQALAVVRKMRPLDRFIPQSDINFFARIFETGDPVRLTRYMEEVLHPIEEAAPRQAGELKRTLLTHLEARYSIKATADALGLHINTVRQRLTTLRQVTGGWDDPVKALEMHMALKLEALFESPGESASDSA